MFVLLCPLADRSAFKHVLCLLEVSSQNLFNDCNVTICELPCRMYMHQKLQPLHAGCCPTNPRSSTQCSKLSKCSPVDISMALKGSAQHNVDIQCSPHEMLHACSRCQVHKRPMPRQMAPRGMDLLHPTRQGKQQLQKPLGRPLQKPSLHLNQSPSATPTSM